MSYHSGFLYMSDGYGNPTEVINEARTAANLRRASSTGAVSRFNLIADNANCPALAYQPCNDWGPDYVKNQVTALRDATLWMDPTFSTTNEVGLQNWGTGGEAMNASYPTPGTSPLLLQHTGTNYLYFPGIANNSATATAIGAYDITGDLEVELDIAFTTLTPSSNVYAFGRGNADPNRAWLFTLTSTGQLNLRWYPTGSIASLISITSTATLGSVGIVANQRIVIKVTLDVDNGAGGNDVRFWYSTNNGVTFTQLGSTVTTAGITNMVPVTAGLTFNVSAGGAELDARVFRGTLRNGIGGPIVFDCDFNRLVNGSETTVTERSIHNRTVTINRATAGRKAVGVVRNTLLFGFDDYLEIPDHTALDGGASSFTVMMAIRQWATPTNFGRYIDKRDINAPNIGWTLSTNGTAIQAYSNIDSGVGTATATGSVFTAGSLALIGFVVDRTANTITTFTNGVAGTPASLVTGAVGDISNGLPVRIGRIANSAGNQDFEMFATGIWNRALTTAEIVELYGYYNTVPPANSLDSTTGWQLIDTMISGAPWYVMGNAASAEGCGFYIEEWTGLDGVHHSRSITPYGPGRGGGTIGRQTSSLRTMAINVLLVGQSNRGLNHLFRWLESTLLSACSCDNPSMWFREYCPDVNSLNDGLARADDVALIGPVQWESPPLEDAGCFVRRASFVLAAGNPCLFREPTSGTSFTSTYASWTTVSNEIVPGDLTTVKDLVPLTVWNSTNCCASVTLPVPAFGTTAPYISISSPLELDNTGQPKYLPNLRVVGLLNPMGTSSSSFGEMFIKGAFVLTGIEAGMEVLIDMASATIKMRRPHKDLSWVDGSRLIGVSPNFYLRFSASNATYQRWFSFDPCDEPVVIVEPNEYYSSLTGKQYVSQWRTTIASHDRFGCV